MAAGRPREFDRDAALDAALDLFWKRGYEATQVDELVGAMGIGRGSMYAAFGDKRSLYLESLDRFIDRVQARYRARLLDGPGRPIENLRAFIRAWPTFAASGRGVGCFISNALIEAAPKDPEVAARITRVLRNEELLLRGLLSEAQDTGEFPASKDAATIARALLNSRLGVTMLARLGSMDLGAQAAADAALLLLE